MPRVVFLAFFAAFVSADNGEARARCPAGFYYRPTQGHCVSAREFQRVLAQIRHYSPAHRAHRAHVRTVYKTKVVTKVVTRTVTKVKVVTKAIVRKPTVEPQALVTLPAPLPVDSLLYQSLPPNVQPWEKQYPWQWN